MSQYPADNFFPPAANPALWSTGSQQFPPAWNAASPAPPHCAARTGLPAGQRSPGQTPGRWDSPRGQFFLGCLYGIAASIVVSAVTMPLAMVVPFMPILNVPALGALAGVVAFRLQRPRMALGMIVGPVVTTMVLGIVSLVLIASFFGFAALTNMP